MSWEYLKLEGASYSLDFSDFNKKMEQYKNLIEQEAAPEGVRKALDQLILDANDIFPRVPHKHGGLEGSGQVDRVEREADGIVGEVSFGKGKSGEDAPYATRWHELPPGEAIRISWTRLGSGPKYLESKMAWYKEKYLEIIALVIKRRAG